MIGMADPYYYRNKVHAVFHTDKSGKIISGVYEPNSHKVVSVDSCLIENRKADETMGIIRGMLKSFRIRTYNEDTKVSVFLERPCSVYRCLQLLFPKRFCIRFCKRKIRSFPLGGMLRHNIFLLSFWRYSMSLRYVFD